MIPPRQLTPDQIAAVQCPERVCFLLAPAGSGKTEVLIRRVIRILSETQGASFRVLAVTFTLKAADELRKRVEQSVGAEAWRVDADTIHGFALDWLRRFGAPVGIPPDVVVYAQRADRFAVLQRYFETLGEPLRDEGSLTQILDRIDQLRTELVATEDAPDEPLVGTDLRLPDIYEAYVIALNSANGVDFPGMLSKFVELIDADPSVARRFRRAYHYVFVDEGQDLTKAQARLLHRLVGDDLQLFVVADARQSINAWAGGGIEWARLLVGNDAIELQLAHNFRCAIRILEVAGRVAKNFEKHRNDAKAPPGSPPGSVEVRSAATESEEAEILADWVEGLLTHGLDESTIVTGESKAVTPEEIGVIARTRYPLDEVWSELVRRGHRVSVQTDTDSLLVTSEARLLHALLEVRDNEKDIPARRRVHDELRNLLPDTAIDLIVSPAQAFDVAFVRREAEGTAVAPLVESAMTVQDSAEGLDQFISAIPALALETEEWHGDSERLQDWWRGYRTSTRAHDRSLQGFLRYLYRVQRTRPDDPGIRLLTTHKAKGLEFRAVAVIGLTQGGFPDYRSMEEVKALDEERRAFYVAVTRASRALLLTWPTVRRSRYGRVWQAQPSQFLAEAGLLEKQPD